MNKEPDIAIIIPARYGSKRFPGKPLARIGTRTMLARTAQVARDAAALCNSHVPVYITTEDTRIAKHAEEIGVPCIMTPDTCRSGSERVLAAAEQMDAPPGFIINLQGDAPFTPPYVIKAVIDMFYKTAAPVITPVCRLTWDNLDSLRARKQKTPFTGTTAVINQAGQALWFSKNIIPAIRRENRVDTYSPVYQHMGLYGYTLGALRSFCALPPGVYEETEGLEQLRLLEHGIPIQTVTVDIEGGVPSGIDSPEDLERVNAEMA